jgi:type VI protein secretion system component VasF
VVERTLRTPIYEERESSAETHTLHWEVNARRRRVSARKVTYWPHILLLETHIAVAFLVRFSPD